MPELGGLAIDWHCKEKGGGKEKRHARKGNSGLGYKPSPIKIIGRVIINPGKEGEEHREVTGREEGIEQALLVCKGSRWHGMERDFNARSSPNSFALILQQ